jgi:hypothetical protein
LKLPGIKPLGLRSTKGYWAEYQLSIALLYAARALPVGDSGKTFLDVLRAGRATYPRHKRLIPEWFGRALFVADHILARCYETTTAEQTKAVLPALPPVPFEAPEFEHSHAEEIGKAFRR